MLHPLIMKKVLTEQKKIPESASFKHLTLHTCNSQFCIISVIGKKDYPCPVCKRGFNHVGSMNRHAKDQHNFDTSTGKYCEYMYCQK